MPNVLIKNSDFSQKFFLLSTQKLNKLLINNLIFFVVLNTFKTIIDYLLIEMN